MIIRPTLACPRKMERTRDWLRRLSGFLLNCSGVPVPPYYTPELKCWRQGARQAPERQILPGPWKLHRSDVAALLQTDSA